MVGPFSSLATLSTSGGGPCPLIFKSRAVKVHFKQQCNKLKCNVNTVQVSIRTKDHLLTRTHLSYTRDTSLKAKKRSEHDTRTFGKESSQTTKKTGSFEKALARCGSGSQIKDVYSTWAGKLSILQLIALLERLASLQRPEEPELNLEIVGQILKDLDLSLQHLSLQDVFTVVRSCDVLEIEPEKKWVKALARALSRALSTANSVPPSEQSSWQSPVSVEDLLSISKTLVSVSFQPDPQWWMTYQRASSYLLPNCSATQLSSMATLVAKWGVRPSKYWLDALCIRCRVVIAELGAKELTVLVWSLATLQASPPRDVVESLLMEAQIKFPEFKMHNLSTLAWSLSMLNVRPPQVWLQDFFKFSEAQLASAAAADTLTNLAWAVSNWGVYPGESWLDKLCKSAIRFLPTMPPKTLSTLSVALANLAHSPGWEWLSVVIEHLHQQIDDATGPDIVGVLASTASMGMGSEENVMWRPPRKWLLRYRPILQDFADAVSNDFFLLSPQDLSNALCAFGALYFNPGEQWLLRHYTYFSFYMDQYSEDDFELINRSYENIQLVWEGYYIPRKGEKF